MSWVAVLGASESHWGYIRAAKELGYRVLVFDGDRDAPCRDEATQFRHVNCADFNSLDAVLNGFQLAGILSNISDLDVMETRAKLTERFVRPGYSLRTFENVYNKTRCKTLLREAGLLTPNWIDVPGSGCGAILVVKPVKGYGGKGVMIADDIHQIYLEDYVDGPEFSLNGFVSGSRIHWLATLRKYGKGMYSDDVCLNAGEIRGWMDTLVESLGISNSFFQVDVILKDGSLYVIDVGLLLDSGIDAMLYEAGVPVYELAVNLAVGRPVDRWHHDVLGWNYGGKTTRRTLVSS